MSAARIVLLAALAPAVAIACGVCVEDKVAATYDHAVITRAAQRGHVVVFAGIEGPSTPAVLAQAAERATRGVRGIDRGTVRVASEPPALAFVVDPKVTRPEAAIAAIEHASSLPNLRLAVVRTVP